MKKNQLLSVGIALFIFGCKNTSDYEKTESGLQYKIHVKNEGAKVKESEFVKVNLTWRNEKDSILQSGQPQPVRVTKPTYKSDFMEGFTLLSKNDSATFLVNVDSMFKGGTPPPNIISGSFWKLDVRVLDIMTEAQIQQMMQAQQQEAMQTAMKQMVEDTKTIETYLSDKKIKAQKTESGIYYTMEKEGKGENAKAGDTVSVHYTGTLLDGTVFQSSRETEPISFVLGQGQVMQGWEEGIALFKKGGKGKLFIPSPLAYGPQSRGEVIKPYSILVFDIELVDIK